MLVQFTPLPLSPLGKIKAPLILLHGSLCLLYNVLNSKIRLPPFQSCGEKKASLLRPPADLLCPVLQVPASHIFTQNNKLISSNTKNILGIKIFQEDVRYGFKHPVSCLMPQVIVNLMEAVYININTAKSPASMLIKLKSLNCFLKAVSVSKVCQGI